MRAGAHVVVLLSALVLASLPTPSLHAQAIPRTLGIAVGIDPDTLDSAGQTTGLVMNIIDYLYERLVAFDHKQNKIVPRLATQWQASPDGLAYTFRLRDGVAFHDGTALNAEAVKFSFDRLLDPKTRVLLREPFTVIKETQVVDPMTVRFILTRPDPVFLMHVANWVASITSPRAVRRAGANLTRDPTGAGTGPYMFKEWVRGTHLRFVRNPTYWGSKPVFEEVMFRIVPDAGAREVMLLAGDVHMAVLPPAPDVPRLRANPRITLVEANASRVIYLGMSTLWGPFKDVRVRQAMNYAVNKRALLKSVLFDLGTAIDSPCVSMVPGHAPVQPGGWPFDPGKARQLLKEAGYAEGFEVDFVAPTGRWIMDFQFAQAIAAQLRAVKVRASVRTMDWPTYVANLDAPPDQTKLQLFALAWVPFPLDCWYLLFPNFHSSQRPGMNNSMFYGNSKVDQLLDQARIELDASRRKTLLKEAQTIVWHDAPWVFLWNQKWYVATAQNLQGVSITPFEMFDAIYATWK